MRLVTSLLLAALALPAAPQQKRPMTFADLMAMKRVSDPQISPSGKWVLFSVTDVSLEKNTKTNHLWVVPLDSSANSTGRGSVSERQLTSGSGESNGRLSPDGKWVMYTADDHGRSQIFIAPWNDADGAIGAGHPVTSLETATDGAIWAPDSRHFVFVSAVWPACESHASLGPQRNEEEARCNADKDAAAAKSPVKAQIFTHLLYRHWTQYAGDKRSHIFYGSTDAPVPTDLTPASVIGDHVAPTFSLGGPLGYAISPDGKEIAYVVNRDKVPAESTNNDIYVLDPAAEPSTAKKVSTSPGSDDGPQYSPDGKWLAWRSQARNGYESDKFDLVVMDRGTRSIRNLTTKFDNWVDEFVWGVDARYLYFTSPAEGEEPIFSIQSLSTDSRIERLTKFGEYGSLQVHSNSALPSDEGDTIVATRMTVDRPTTINSLQTAKGHTVAIGSNAQPVDLNARSLEEIEMSPLESFWFPGANGTKVQGFLIKPPNFDPSKKYPVKFLIHGGPQGAWGDAWSYRWNPELFAANGYVVVMINPRGSTGYGQRFLEEVSGDWGGRPYVDLMKGLDYAEQHYSFIDKDRECALGASYGGYMANWVLTHTNRFKCIVTHDGMYNPQSAFGTTEELWFNEWEFRPLANSSTGVSSRPKSARSADEVERPASRTTTNPGAPRLDSETWEDDRVVEQTAPAHPWDFFDKPASEDPFRKWSPMLSIKNAHTPTLIIHSQLDYRLDVSEGLQLFTALQLLGVPSKMLYFPDEGHWVLKPQNSELWYKTADDWCDRWTGTNKYAGAGPEKNPAAAPSKPASRSSGGP